MNHRNILAVLTALVLALGLTIAQSLVQIEKAQAQTPEPLDPEQVLTGDVLRKWHALTPENQALVISEIIPDIPGRVPDANLRAGVLANLVSIVYDMVHS